MWLNAREAERNAAEALEVRNNAENLNRRLEEANRLVEQAIVLQREGKSSQADALVKQAQQVQDEKAGSVLTASELSELDRLRRQESAWRQTEVDLRSQLAASRAAAPNPDVTPPSKSDLAAAERTELERLRNVESVWERDAAQLRQQLAAANDRSTKSQQAESALRKSNEELQASLGQRDPGPPRQTDTAVRQADKADIAGIEQVLREYAAAYERRDAEAVVKLMPSANGADLTRSFSQLRAYRMEILDPQISVAGDTAVVNCARRVSIEPKVGSRPAPRLIQTVFRLRQSQGEWKIESVQEKR